FELGTDSVQRSYTAGDVVEGEIELMLTPENAAAYWGDDGEFRDRLVNRESAWQPVHDEFRFNNLMQVVAQTGQVLEHYPVRIAPADGEVAAAFTVQGGGIGHVPVIIEGVEAGGALRAERYVDGQWRALGD